MLYTHLNNNGYKDQALAWNGMYLSESTQKHRNQLKHGMDDFTNFYWRGVDAFSTFGAFIINNKGTLKFYNGPTYTNEYSKPQFESAAGQLTGVTFQIQKIDFTIGVYWINEKDYRQLINWLNPYEINTLCFDFEPNYYYQVKLASVADGPRHIVGKEYNINYKGTFSTIADFENVHKPAKCLIQGNATYKYNHVYDIINGSLQDLGRAIDFEYEYYTEIKLTFEVQGPACAYNKIPYIFENSSESMIITNNDETQVQGYKLTMSYSSENLTEPSDLEVPIKIIYDLDTTQIAESLTDTKEYLLSLECKAEYTDENNYTDSISLFSVVLKNLSYLMASQYCINGHIMIEYDSESGLLFLLNGDSDYYLLNTLTTSSQGKKILDSMIVNKYVIAGQLNFYNFDWHNLKFITISHVTTTSDDLTPEYPGNQDIFGNNCQLLVRGRTNII